MPPSSPPVQRTNPTPGDRWTAQKRGWALLKGLRPTALDFSQLPRLREAPLAFLRGPRGFESIMLDLGLNNEGLAEFPLELHPHCGSGLRIWQYPIQFGPYLRYLNGLGVRSYLEVGIRHGGSYVLTVEALNRFLPLDWSVAIDVIDCPSMQEYSQLNPRSSFACLNTKSAAFATLLESVGPVDLAFIDSHHEAEQLRVEVATLRPFANILALHDIHNIGCPGVGLVWNELKATGDYDCVEFVAQYPGLGPFMGIGVAVRRARTAGSYELRQDDHVRRGDQAYNDRHQGLADHPRRTRG